MKKRSLEILPPPPQTHCPRFYRGLNGPDPRREPRTAGSGVPIDRREASGSEPRAAGASLPAPGEGALLPLPRRDCPAPSRAEADSPGLLPPSLSPLTPSLPSPFSSLQKGECNLGRGEGLGQAEQQVSKWGWSPWARGEWSARVKASQNVGKNLGPNGARI